MKGQKHSLTRWLHRPRQNHPVIPIMGNLPEGEAVCGECLRPLLLTLRGWRHR